MHTYFLVFKSIFELLFHVQWPFQIEKLRTQAQEQESTLLAQEEEVHGKQRELNNLKDEEKKLLEEIKQSEKEISKLSHDLGLAEEINSEVGVPSRNFVVASFCRILRLPMLFKITAHTCIFKTCAVFWLVYAFKTSVFSDKGAKTGPRGGRHSHGGGHEAIQDIRRDNRR